MIKFRDIIPPQKRRMRKKRFLDVVVCAILIIELIAPSILSPLPAFAYFSNTRRSENNIFSTGTLGLETATSTVDFVPDTIAGNATSTFDVVVSDDGTIEPEYEVLARDIVGDGEACQYLEINAVRNDLPEFSGSLELFKVSDLSFATSTADGSVLPDNWHFEIKFSDSAAKNIANGSKCDFNLVFNAWQNGIGDKTDGFHSLKIIPVSIKLANVPTVTVMYPNGYPQPLNTWYIVPADCVNHDWCQDWCVAHNMNDQCQYKITWDAINNGGKNKEDLTIDIWYSTNSGQAWQEKVAQGAPNNGSFLWKIPYDYSLVSETARIKVVATDINDPTNTNWDESDADFCPPLFTMEDLENQEFGMLAASGAPTQDISIVPMTLEDINHDINYTATQGAADGLTSAIINSTTTQVIANVQAPNKSTIDDLGVTQAPTIPAAPVDPTDGIAPVSQVPAIAPEIAAPEIDSAAVEN
jgi:hypothetical protein